MKISYHISTLTAICVLLTSTVFAQGKSITVDPKDFSPICLVANVTANDKFLTVNFNKQSAVHLGPIGKKKQLLSRFKIPEGSGNVKLNNPRAVVLESQDQDVMFYAEVSGCEVSPLKAKCKIQHLQTAQLIKKAQKVKKLKAIKDLPVCIYGKKSQ